MVETVVLNHHKIVKTKPYYLQYILRVIPVESIVCSPLPVPSNDTTQGGANVLYMEYTTRDKSTTVD